MRPLSPRLTALLDTPSVLEQAIGDETDGLIAFVQTNLSAISSWSNVQLQEQARVNNQDAIQLESGATRIVATIAEKHIQEREASYGGFTNIAIAFAANVEAANHLGASLKAARFQRDIVALVRFWRKHVEIRGVRNELPPDQEAIAVDYDISPISNRRGQWKITARAIFVLSHVEAFYA